MKYYSLQRRSWQENPISAYLFIIALDTLFALIFAKKDVSDLNIFDHDFYIQHMLMTPLSL